MSASDRRQQLLKVLCFRRKDTCLNLAHEFNVSERTIRYDIEALMCRYPIETVRGRFGGGVKVADWYYLECKSLNADQIELLTRLRDQLKGKDRDIINSILTRFTS